MRDEYSFQRSLLKWFMGIAATLLIAALYGAFSLQQTVGRLDAQVQNLVSITTLDRQDRYTASQAAADKATLAARLLLIESQLRDQEKALTDLRVSQAKSHGSAG